MSNEIAQPEAQSGTAAPAEVATPATEEVTSGAEPQDGAIAETPASAKPSRAQERIEELNAQKKAALEYGEFWRQRFEESQQKPTPNPQAQEQSEPEPNADDFIDPKDYTRAYTSWARKETDKAIRKAALEAKAEAKAESEQALTRARESERLKALDEGFASRAQQYADKNPDFWDAIKNPALKFFNGEFLEAAKASDLGPDVLHHIAKSPQLAAKLASQTIPQRLAMLGRLEAELSRPAPPPKVTAAPPPPVPVGGGQGGDTDPSKMSIDDWMAWRTKQIREGRSAR